MKGFFKPKFPSKYKGNPTNIVYRSSWELKYFMYLDHSSDVLQWSSEEIVVPYVTPDTRLHRYFPDAWVKRKDGIYLVEIKPYHETIPPKQGKKFLQESMTYVKNQCKWNAAKRYAEQRGWKFVVLTEHELGIPGYKQRA